VLPGGVAADDEDAIRILDLVNGIGHGPGPERGGKTCHRGGVSEACAVINIIGT
jgi:hypothetical protein